MRLAQAVASSFLLGLTWAAYTDKDLQSVLRAKGKSGIISVNDENFEKVLYGPRDYHLIHFMTSDSPQINCVLCRQFEPDFKLVANSFAKSFPGGEGLGPDQKNVYFLHSEFADSRNLFQLMNLDSIPKIFHFGPTPDDAPEDAFHPDSPQYQFMQGDHKAMLLQWVKQKTGTDFDLYIPLNYGMIAFNAVVAFLLVLLIRKYFKQVAMVFRSPFLWGAATIVVTLIFLSGEMFNQIRGTPYMRDDGRHAEYIAPSAQNQYGLESQVVSTLYGSAALCFLILANKVPSIENPKAQLVAAVTVAFLLYLVYGIYLNVFSFKYRGYPYVLFQVFGL